MTRLTAGGRTPILLATLLSSAFIFSSNAYTNESESFTFPFLNTEKTEQEEQDYSGGYLKVGYGYKSEISPYHDEDYGGALFISARYQWELGFFIEASHGAKELDQGVNVGFNFYNTDDWHFDVLTATALGSHEYGYRPPNGVSIVETRSSSTMLGLRASGVLHDTQLQFIVAPYTFNDNYDDAIYASAWASKSWQIKNWEVYVSGGLEYRSKEILDYYYSTSDIQKELGLPDYTATGGMDVIAQVGVSYPISENVLFETYYRYTDLSDSIMDSPIMRAVTYIPSRDEDIKEFGILLSYVF